MISDFRLHVFHTVAKRLSFTKAAEALFITQPAVTKHIRGLEQQYQARLFERRGNSIVLTDAGKMLLRYTGRLEQLYTELDGAMNLLNGLDKGALRLGASTTIAQYVLPHYLAAFRQKFPDIKLQVQSGNTEEIERLLLNSDIELGFIEGHSRNKQIRYEVFQNDALIPVVRAGHPAVSGKNLKPVDLTSFQLIMREEGSGTLEVVQLALKKAGLKWHQLNIALQLDSTEAIKTYLLHSDSLAFVSKAAIEQEVNHGILRELKFGGMMIARPLYLIYQQGEPTRLAGLFRKFISSHNLK